MRARSVNGRAIHEGILSGDLGFGFLRFTADCGVQLSSWQEVASGVTTCKGCLKRARK